MSTKTSGVLDAHFKKKTHTLTHLEYLDKILGSINKVHIQKVLDMRNTIELTLLSNPDSESEVVSYLSQLNTQLSSIQNKSETQMQNAVFGIAA